MEGVSRKVVVRGSCPWKQINVSKCHANDCVAIALLNRRIFGNVFLNRFEKNKIKNNL